MNHDKSQFNTGHSPLWNPLHSNLWSPFSGSALAGGGGSAPAWSPDATFFSGSKGFAYDFTDPTKLFQLSDGTVAVTANSDPIGYVTDLSRNGKHGTQSTAANRPLYQGYADFDGSNDSILVPAPDFTGTTAITMVVSVRKDVSGLGFVFDATSSAVDRFGFWLISDDGTNNWEFYIASSANPTLRATGYAAPVTSTISCVLDTSGTSTTTEIIPRVDGATPSLTVHVAGNSTTFPFTANAIHIGQRTNATARLNGRIWRAIIIGRRLTADEILQAEAWVSDPLA